MAPFIADVASRAGAMYIAYEIGRPSGPGTDPTSAPIPTPMASR